VATCGCILATIQRMALAELRIKAVSYDMLIFSRGMQIA
jgi:hypothetical protein